MDISVIVPCYNQGQYVQRAVRSAFELFASRGLAVEVIVVDDGSTDSTRKSVISLADECPRLKYLFQENRGPASARNRALRNAAGKFVIFLDADDCLVDHGAPWLDLIEQGKHELVVFRSNANRSVPAADNQEWTSEEIFRDLCRGFVPQAPWGKAFQRSFLLKHHIEFPEDMRLGEDLFFLLAVLEEKPKTILIDMELVSYTPSEDSITSVTPALKQLYKLEAKLFARFTLSDGADRRRIAQLYVKNIVPYLLRHKIADFDEHLRGLILECFKDFKDARMRRFVEISRLMIRMNLPVFSIFRALYSIKSAGMRPIRSPARS